METRFSWIPLYTELAHKLLDWESRQSELIKLLEEVRASGVTVTPLIDRDEEGARFLLTEIDPFTVFGTFNRNIREEHRLAILRALKQKLGAESPLPEDFAGLPVLNNMGSWFFDYSSERTPEDVPHLWKTFRLALSPSPFADPEFAEAFNRAQKIRFVSVNLTMALFWMRPDTFLGLDEVNRSFLNLKLPSKGLNAAFYRKCIEDASKRNQPFYELSYEAWLESQKIVPPPPPPLPQDNDYWLVGAHWAGAEPQDQTARFVSEGMWQNGYVDKYLDEVSSMKVGDRIAIKATHTQKHDLPFDAAGKTVSKMSIKAIGTVTANRGDGRTVEVEWDSTFAPKDWYFFTHQHTIWKLDRSSWKVQRLIDFVFNGKTQNYSEWLKSDETITPVPPYSVDDLIASGAFIDKAEVETALSRLEAKKNLILQGPPGVGKTYLAKRLAYVFMGEKADERIEFVQFHQSYSYEDFVRGYRPKPDGTGGFSLQNGVFFDACRKASEDPDAKYVFIVDEINRGNLSQIFGELLMLIEADKRGVDHSVPLVYRLPGEPKFFVPENLYLIGLMNLADRSLALVDYALRRRFAFLTLRPRFESASFKNWLVDREMDVTLVDRVIARMKQLNSEIRSDSTLGEHYEVGHSFFCPRGESFKGLDASWYEDVIATEIVPLLKEYWFDNAQRADEARGKLLAP